MSTCPNTAHNWCCCAAVCSPWQFLSRPKVLLWASWRAGTSTQEIKFDPGPPWSQVKFLGSTVKKSCKCPCGWWQMAQSRAARLHFIHLWQHCLSPTLWAEWQWPKRSCGKSYRGTTYYWDQHWRSFSLWRTPAKHKTSTQERKLQFTTPTNPNWRQTTPELESICSGEKQHWCGFKLSSSELHLNIHSGVKPPSLWPGNTSFRHQATHWASPLKCHI